jgi:hypothetical protein
MAQERIGQFGLEFAGLDLHAQVYVALADLEKIDALAQLARHRLGRRPLHVEFGGVFHQRLGVELRRTCHEHHGPGNADEERDPEPWNSSVFSRDAAAFAHQSPSPCVRRHVYRLPRRRAIGNRQWRQGL